MDYYRNILSSFVTKNIYGTHLNESLRIIFETRNFTDVELNICSCAVERLKALNSTNLFSNIEQKTHRFVASERLTSLQLL